MDRASGEHHRRRLIYGVNDAHRHHLYLGRQRSRRLSKTKVSKKSDKPEANSRELILDAVAEILTEQQSVDVSVSEIGKKSGLNPALVNYYFGSKSRMMFELVVQTIRPSIDRLDELAEMDLPADEKLERHIKAIAHSFFRYPFVNRLIHRVSRIDEGAFAKELSDIIVKPMFAAVEDILQQGLREGSLRAVDPVFFFFQVNGACDAIFHSRYALRHAFGKKRITQKMTSDYADQIVKLVLDGISV